MGNPKGSWEIGRAHLEAQDAAKRAPTRSQVAALRYRFLEAQTALVAVIGTAEEHAARVRLVEAERYYNDAAKRFPGWRTRHA